MYRSFHDFSRRRFGSPAALSCACTFVVEVPVLAERRAPPHSFERGRYTPGPSERPRRAIPTKAIPTNRAWTPYLKGIPDTELNQ